MYRQCLCAKRQLWFQEGKDKKKCVNELAEETAPTHLLRHMIKEDAEDAPDAALRCAFCASAPFLFAIVIL